MHEQSKDIETNENQTKFVSILKDLPILMDKSMLPEVKQKRRLAMKELKNRLQAELGKTMTEPQIWKKIQNMKSRLKKKADVNRARNKKMILKPWEEEFLDFMEGDANPSIVKVKGCMTAGTSSPSQFNDQASYFEEDLNENEDDPTPDCSANGRSPKPQTDRTKIKKRKTILSAETAETKKLSTPELQRLVLLEQLKTFRKAQELIDMQIKLK